MWNPDTGALKVRLKGHTDRISALAFSSDGATLASGSWDRTIRLWNTHTAELKTAFEGQRREIQSLAFAPDGKTLASGSGWEDTIIRLWDTDIAQQIGRLETYTRWVYALAFSPDIQGTSGMFLASGSGDGTIRVWHLDSGSAPTDRPQMTLTAHTDGVLALAFSPNSTAQYNWVLASGSRDGTLRLWKLTVGESTPRSLALHGHTADVQAVAFSPDGRTLASASRDKTIRLWNVHSGEHYKTLYGHADSVTSLAFSPDGKTLASASSDNTILLWEFEPELAQNRWDLNGDRLVNIQDLTLIASRFGQDTPDLNGDGIVNILDLVLIANQLGK